MSWAPPAALTLDEVLRARAARDPDGAALIYAREPHLGRTCSWAELDALADGFAQRLIGEGVAPGSRVAIVLVDEPACLGAVYGILRAGAIVVPIDSAWGATSIRNLLAHAAPALVTASGRAALHECGLGDTDARFVAFGDLERGSAVPTRATVDDVAMLAFTAGTTSQSKGVVIRHRHFRSAYGAGAEQLGLRDTRRFGCMFRLSGIGILGMNYFFAHEVGAATVVLPEFSLASVRTFWKTVEQHAVEFIYLVPAVVQIMNKVSEPPSPPAQRAVPIRCVTAAAPITARSHAEFQERFQAPLRNAYGLTEASFAVFFGADSGHGSASRSIGPARGIEARLLAPDGSEVHGAGTGELEIRGPMVTDGYWRNEDATARLFHDGWLRTGDLAERDADGNYQICGRTKDVVIRGGFNIHLSEVEEVLLAHPNVAGACAVGVPDRLTGEELYAVVQLVAGGVEAQEIERWARMHLGQGRAPRRIFVVDELQRNGAGKVNRARVVAEITARLPSTSPAAAHRDAALRQQP